MKAIISLESETRKMSEKIEAETKSNVSKILMQKEMVIKEGKKKIQEIESHYKCNIIY